MKKIREQFKRAVIEAIHELPYEEAVMKDAGLSMKFITKKIPQLCVNCGRQVAYMSNGVQKCKYCCIEAPIKIRPITIGRVIQALGRKEILKHGRVFFVNKKNFIMQTNSHDQTEMFVWKLTKENEQECTDDDQNNETIEALTKLLV